MYVRTNSTLIVCVAGFLMTACAFLSRAQQPVSGAGAAVSSVLPDAPTPQIEVALAADPWIVDTQSGQAQNPEQPATGTAPAPAPSSSAAQSSSSSQTPPNPKLHRKPSARRPRNKFESRNISAWRESCLRSTSPTLAINRLSQSRREVQAAIPSRHRPLYLYARGDCCGPW